MISGSPAGAGRPGFGSAPAGSAGSRSARGGRTGADADRAGPVAGPADLAELARKICLRQLAARPCTRAELAALLHRRGIPDEVISTVLDRYDEVGIIDDEAFARAWVTSRHHGRGLARRALAGELRRKGVDGSAVDEALAELDPAVEIETARALVSRRLAGVTGSPDAVFRRLVGMLARKGYPATVAVRVVKDALAARSESAEFADGIDTDALAHQADPEGG